MSGFASVKCVLSGDMMVLMGASKGGPPPLRRVTLSNVSAPRLARGPDATDEPFAWDCRERIRKLCVGKRVKFTVVRPAEGNRPEAVDIMLQDGTNPAEVILKEGLAKLRPGREADKRSPLFQKLELAAQVAQETNAGMWNPAPGTVASHVRDVKWRVTNPTAFLASVKGKAQRAIVEGVRDGSSLRCILLPSYQMVTFCLAGVMCPRMNYGKRPAAAPAAPARATPAAAAPPAVPAAAGSESKGTEGAGAGAGAGAGSAESRSYLASAGGSATAQGAARSNSNAEPFAEMAKHFVEVRLLNVEVMLHINGFDKFQNFFGDVQFAKGDITMELVKAGLARMVDWSIGHTTSQKATLLRAAEAAAKASKLRIWKNYVPQVITGRKNYTGVVAEVITGDTIVVRVDGDSRELRKVHLASTRAPYPGRRDGEGAEPWGYQSKEYVRKAAIARAVSVRIDYQRGPRVAEGSAPADDAPKKDYATVRLVARKGQPNLAELLIGEGLASVVRHGASDDNRSSQYDALVAASQRAESAKKRIHAPKGSKVPQHRVQNLIGNPAKARAQQSFLQREPVLKGVVEFVHGAGRVKLHLTQQNTVLNFALGGIQCPRTARRATAERAASGDDKFGPEALQFMRDATLQRDVEVSVDAMDQRGCAIGPMFIGHGGKRRDIAVELLSRGFAKCMRNVDRASNGEALMRAEAAAKAAGKGVWQGWVEPEEKKTGDAAQYTATITVADVLDGANFTAHKANEAQKLLNVNQAMAAIKTADGTSGGPVEVVHGKVLAALFDDGSGDQWFRARVHGGVRTNAAGKRYAQVTFIDYGNSDEVTVDRMRALDPAVGRIPPLAHFCTLAYIRVQEASSPLGHDAGVLLNELVWGVEGLKARVHSTDGEGRLYLSVTSPSSEGTTVQELLVNAGLARLSASQARYATPGDAELVNALKKAQSAAKSEHVGMFRYGDVGDSDDEM